MTSTVHGAPKQSATQQRTTTASETMDSLRELRRRAQALQATLVDDVAAFLRADKLSFRRHPDSDNTKPDVSVATTSSALMALSLAGKLDKVYKDASRENGAAPLKTDEPITKTIAKAKVNTEKKRNTAKGPDSKKVKNDTDAGVEARKGGKSTKAQVLDAIGLMMRSAWDSSALPPDNAFTRSILLRTLGLLVKHGSVDVADVSGMLKEELSPRERAQKALKVLKADDALVEVATATEKAMMKVSGTRGQLTLQEVVNLMAARLPDSLKVLDYLPTATLGYWFVAGVDALKLTLTSEQWGNLAKWARGDVAKQIGLITSKHDARMDPVAMAMAACLAARLRNIALRVGGPAPATLVDELPSAEELKTAVRLLFARQAESGIWPKYFPLFHYPSAGANYPFSFELLEAILHELIEPEFLLEPEILQGFERAIGWCESNRLEHLYEGKKYRGWNSGGELTTLTRSVPESWATAVVHMFAFELEAKLNETINKLVLRKYRSTQPAGPKMDKFEGFINIDIPLGGTQSSVKKVLTDEILLPAQAAATNRIFALQRRWSGLLFGPPGTSKTSLVKAVAAYLGWPYVEVNPSDFLKRGLEQVPIQADEVFADLMDLSKAVVLFDEMDAIVKRREKKDTQEQRLDPTSEMLTTSMLPKLAQLHDKGQVIFFFATNHREDLDSAITRPGRFDIWLCMGPPKWSAKLEHLDKILDRFVVPKKAVEKARALLKKWVDDSDAKDAAELMGHLDLFTFAEVQSFLEYLCRSAKKSVTQIDEALEQLKGEHVRNEIREWYTKSITLRPSGETSARTEYDKDVNQSKLQ